MVILIRGSCAVVLALSPGPLVSGDGRWGWSLDCLVRVLVGCGGVKPLGGVTV